MSKYTTEVRYICETYSGLKHSVDYPSIDEVLDLASPKIFDFSFPIFDESYRSILERKILKHYYTREIGEETVGLWKLRLNTKLNEIMPYYNKLYNSELLEFNPLYTVNLTRDKNTELDRTRDGQENIIDNTSSKTEKEYGYSRDTETDGRASSVSGSASSSNGASESTKYDLYSDTPQGALNGLDSGTYLTNAKKNTDNGSTSGSSQSIGNESGENHDEGTENLSGTDSTSGSVGYTRSRGDSDKVNSVEDYLEHVVGYEGTNGSKMLMEYRETFLNIDMMVIKELEPLFFQLW